MRLIAQVYPHFDPGAQWLDGDSRVIAESPIFELLKLKRESPQSHIKADIYRLSCPEWVHVIPFTAPDAGLELLVVEQYRHGVDRASLEVPGGLCDPGEDPLDSAKRELLEETGHVSNDWTSLGSCSPNPAIQNNQCHFFLALNCVPIRDLVLDPTEELRLWAMSHPEWKARLESGEVHHSLVIAAFQRLYMSKAWAPLQQQINEMQS